LPEDVEKIFEKYMDHMDRGGPCLTSNLLSVFDADKAQNLSGVSESFVRQKIAGAFRTS
jgi:hypothetical protein